MCLLHAPIRKSRAEWIFFNGGMIYFTPQLAKVDGDEMKPVTMPVGILS
jgi:hypothetical protein